MVTVHAVKKEGVISRYARPSCYFKPTYADGFSFNEFDYADRRVLAPSVNGPLGERSAACLHCRVQQHTASTSRQEGCSSVTTYCTSDNATPVANCIAVLAAKTVNVFKHRLRPDTVSLRECVYIYYCLLASRLIAGACC